MKWAGGHGALCARLALVGWPGLKCGCGPQWSEALHTEASYPDRTAESAVIAS